MLVIEPLDSDYNRAIEHWRKDTSSQFWSRTVIRCLCADIEARLFVLRKMAEKLATASGVKFGADELEILSEQRIVTKKGVQNTKRKWLPLPDSVKESFRLFAKGMGAPLAIDYGLKGYSDLCNLFETRNRLMHPKTTFDVAVNPQNVETANQGIHWFNETCAEVFRQCTAHTANMIEIALKSISARTSR